MTLKNKNYLPTCILYFVHYITTTTTTTINNNNNTCSIEVGRNICHGSDAVESAEHEIALWFPEGMCAWDSCGSRWVYE
jgi:hypothetical protein